MSGLAARDLARAMARTHLQAGHDVLVCQFLGRLDFVEALDQMAAVAGVPFVEVALVTELGESLERFLRRSRNDSRPEHRDAALLLDRAGGPDALAEMQTRLESVVRARPNTRRVGVVDGDLEETYRGLLRAILSRVILARLAGMVDHRRTSGMPAILVPVTRINCWPAGKNRRQQHRL